MQDTALCPWASTALWQGPACIQGRRVMHKRHALADPLCLSSIHNSSLERKQSKKESKWLPLPLTHMLPPAPSTASHCSCTHVWVNYFLHLAVRVFYRCHSREQSVRGRACHRELTSPKWHIFLLYMLVTFSINCHTILPLLKIYKILPVLSFSFRMLWIISTNYENKCFPTGLHIANHRPALAAACVGPRLQIWTELSWGSWGGPLPFPVSPLLPQLHRCSIPVSQLLCTSPVLTETPWIPSVVSAWTGASPPVLPQEWE